ncbi:hypothetical protein Pcinc_014822 [Petrolisthes cinctipes]|uniref:HTH CENPB-type domain-containing protein n=1 Tax=Petrolisthes cinctipes TaxID=88211 RepID=A0AAE1FU98_PETCI|nr:hypothetical protein Pcinc_014822 [Petrolisthes cinctipes]
MKKKEEVVKKKREYCKGQTLKMYTTEDKTKIMKMMDDGLKIYEIHCLTGFPQSTIRTMKGKKEDIKKSLSLVKKYFAANPSSQRRLTCTYSESNRLIAMTEYYVEKWLSRWAKEGASVNGPQVREQARVFYSTIVAKKKIKHLPEFNASVGWLARFKKRCGVKYAKYQGELASTDSEASAEFPSIAKQITADGGYCPDQIYNCDETGLYWKRSPKGTFIAQSEKQAPGVKMAKDRFSVLLTCNASGSHRMKPLVIYKFKKPHAYKDCDMKKLNVYWESNKSGYMQASLSVEWFDNYFVPDAYRKCKELNLDFKVVFK